MESMVDYFFELGQLKRTPRSGWSLTGVAQPESVAEHSYRTALIAYALAVEEGLNAPHAACLALVHDTAEARVGDLHHLARRSVDWDGVEERASKDQLARLPVPLRDRLSGLFGEAGEKQSPEAVVAKDADLLECLMQACEYRALGHPVDEWIESSRNALRTDAARRIAAAAVEAPVDRWRRPERA